MSLDSTVGGASANSYVTQATAATYFADRLDATEWDDAVTGGTAESALIMATTRLDAERYRGSRTYSTQRLQWPRWGVYDPDDIWMYSHQTIPDPIKVATYELALVILKDTTYMGDTGLEAFDSVTVGPLSIDPRHQMTPALPGIVLQVLQHLLLGGGFSTKVVRA